MYPILFSPRGALFCCDKSDIIDNNNRIKAIQDAEILVEKYISINGDSEEKAYLSTLPLKGIFIFTVTVPNIISYILLEVSTEKS